MPFMLGLHYTLSRYTESMKLKHHRIFVHRLVINFQLADVIDGKVWKEFLDSDGNAFFSTPLNLVVMPRVDWFEPYKHTNHSCGVFI